MTQGRLTAYFVKRTLLALLTVFFAITLNFILFRAAPGDVVTRLDRVPQANAAQRLAIRREFGLDESKWKQYVLYLKQLSRGNLGISFQSRQPVSDELKTAVKNSLPMVLTGVLLAVVLGVTAGVCAAWSRGTIVDHATVGSALVLFAMPAQWLGLIAIMAFAGLLPTGGRIDDFLVDPTWWEHAVDVVKHMVLPSSVLALGLFGQYAIITRAALLETFGEDYVLTARAKGFSQWQVVRKHALRNAMLPISTLIALSLGYMVGGAILVETVFSWPGIGRAVYAAVLARDYPMLQGAFLILTISVVTFNYIADLTYARLDPRIVL